MAAELSPVTFKEAAFALALYEEEQPTEVNFEVRILRRIKDHTLLEPETQEGKAMVGIIGYVDVHVTECSWTIHGKRYGPLPMVLNPVCHMEKVLPFMYELRQPVDVGDPTLHRFRTLEIAESGV